MADYRLSVLDQTPIAEGMTAADALANTLDLARTADALGYHRYWLAEHHASPALAGVAPEALIGPVALATNAIRVGSGGVMLPHSSPFRVAETFRMLGALAPGRIDLGLGRAPGTDRRASVALQRDRSRHMPDDFTDQLTELLGYLGDGLPEGHPFAPLHASLPDGTAGSPAPWMLGSSGDSARWAAELGLPYCFADFINADGAGHAATYRAAFQSSRWADRPTQAVAVWTIAAPTREEAERLAAPAQMMFAHLVQGRLIKVPTIEMALAWAADHPQAGSGRHRRSVVGTPAEVRAGLDEVAALYHADELLLVNILPDHAARRRSYELIAAEYALAPLAEAA